jgi:hypothetical protein
MIHLGIKQFSLYISDKQVLCVDIVIQGDQKVCAAEFFFGVRCKCQCIQTIPTQLMIWRWPSQNTIRMRTVLYWTRSSRIQFGVSINVWRLAGDTLNITCNCLYCNHQVHRDFLLTLYNSRNRIKRNTLSEEKSFLDFLRPERVKKWPKSTIATLLWLLLLLLLLFVNILSPSCMGFNT